MSESHLIEEIEEFFSVPSWSMFCATIIMVAGITVAAIYFTVPMRRSLRMMLLPLIPDLTLFVLVYNSAGYALGRRGSMDGPALFFLRLPIPVRIGVLMFFMLLALIRLCRVIWIRVTSITSASVGEALDKLPMGISFTSENGQIMQYNRTLDHLCERISGEAYINGKLFWDLLENRQVLPGVEVSGEEKKLVTFTDGDSWLIGREHTNTKIGAMVQLQAVNVTEEQKAVRELEEVNKALKDRNRHLRRYNTIVDETIRAEEQLETKKRIHDNMGEELLAAKIYLTGQDTSIQGRDIQNRWKRDLRMLLTEAKEEEPSSLISELSEAAEYLGVRLIPSGQFPEDFDVMHVIGVAVQECMTNAIAHAHADELYVDITEDEAEYHLRITNNGMRKYKKVTEGGGLGLVRRTAERIGARVEYPDGRQFVLLLHIPKERVEFI